MTAQELYDGVARAVEAAKPAQEYCFLWIDHWSTCMTKAEWSGWMQAVFSVAAILAAALLTRWQITHQQETAQRLAALRRLELAEVALHVCSRSHRLSKSTSYDLLNGERGLHWLKRSEERWSNMTATLDALAAKEMSGEELKIVLDSRGFASVVLYTCRAAQDDAGPLGVDTASLIDLFRARWNTTQARWNLRRMVRAQKRSVLSRMS